MEARPLSGELGAGQEEEKGRNSRLRYFLIFLLNNLIVKRLVLMFTDISGGSLPARKEVNSPEMSQVILYIFLL